MNLPQCFTQCAAIARKHGRMAIGIEGKIVAEGIATEIEGAAPASSAGGGGVAEVGPPNPAHGQPPDLSTQRRKS